MQSVNFNLNIGVIKISMVENASAVNIGKNLLLDWDSNSKTNQGLGNISGDQNALDHLVNHLEDPDKIDQLSQMQPEAYEKKDLHNLVEIFFEEGKNEDANQA